MTKNEIIKALDEDKKVFWSNPAYQVFKHSYSDGTSQYLITCLFSNSSVGLFHTDGKLSDKEETFFIA